MESVLTVPAKSYSLVQVIESWNNIWSWG